MATNNAVNTSLQGQTGTGTFVGASSPTLTTPNISQINISSGNPALALGNAGSSQDILAITAVTGQPQMTCIGASTNMNMLLSPKGSGALILSTGAGGITPLWIYSGTTAQRLSRFVFADISATTDFTFPNTSGTVALTTPTTSWTPTFTFTSPGDLSVSYASRQGFYSISGSVVTVSFFLGLTPTFTTASGGLQITGLPVASSSSTNYYGAGVIGGTTAWTAPAGTTSFGFTNLGGTSYISVNASGSGVAVASLVATNITSGNNLTIAGTLTYLI